MDTKTGQLKQILNDEKQKYNYPLWNKHKMETKSLGYQCEIWVLNVGNHAYMDK